MTYHGHSRSKLLSIGFSWLVTVVFGHAGVAAAANIIHVPTEVSDLQSAISQVMDGGIIEIVAGTVLSAPAAAG